MPESVLMNDTVCFVHAFSYSLPSARWKGAYLRSSRDIGEICCSPTGDGDFALHLVQEIYIHPSHSPCTSLYFKVFISNNKIGSIEEHYPY